MVFASACNIAASAVATASALEIAPPEYGILTPVFFATGALWGLLRGGVNLAGVLILLANCLFAFTTLIQDPAVPTVVAPAMLFSGCFVLLITSRGQLIPILFTTGAALILFGGICDTFGTSGAHAPLCGIAKATPPPVAPVLFLIGSLYALFLDLTSKPETKKKDQ
eukprot:NODE_18247_length_903_cov_1.859536.p2 GENE.NODE_18247_length_903_cov_1.859536~~NODE_18247_length_903_cov_1.859536.p2  ORF type:complete len:167 (-),score=52.23 NODE_18247_length_903_cov_1.859536:298-798(-)